MKQVVLFRQVSVVTQLHQGHCCDPPPLPAHRDYHSMFKISDILRYQEDSKRPARRSKCLSMPDDIFAVKSVWSSAEIFEGLRLV
jgi:hypothetical protein